MLARRWRPPAPISTHSASRRQQRHVSDPPFAPPSPAKQAADDPACSDEQGEGRDRHERRRLQGPRGEELSEELYRDFELPQQAPAIRQQPEEAPFGWAAECPQGEQQERGSDGNEPREAELPKTPREWWHAKQG